MIFDGNLEFQYRISKRKKMSDNNENDPFKESKVKGSGKGFLGAWGPTIGGFLVGGPFGAAVGAGLGELISRKVNTGEWTGSYEENTVNNNEGNNYSDLLKRTLVLRDEAKSIFDNYSKISPEFDFSDFLLENINDSQIKKDFITYMRSILLTVWMQNAKENNFTNDFPSAEEPIIRANTWEDLPLFLDEAFLPRFIRDQNELLWALNIKDKFPERKDLTRNDFTILTMAYYLDIIASLESLVGRDIANNYGEPNTSDPKYWEIKREINNFYGLQESPEEILCRVIGSKNPYRGLDDYINHFTS